MKKMILLIPVFLLLTGCGLSPLDEGKNIVLPEKTVIREETTLFSAGSDSTQTIFETNETRYLTQRGYTLWKSVKINQGDDFESVRVSLCKERGKSEAGYGIVFCCQEIDEKPFMLTVLINTAGFYTVGKISDGVFTHLNEGWKSSAFINRGYGMRNDIEVTYNSTQRNFNLKINDYDTATFTVSENIIFQNSRSGYAAVIASDERFPDIPVRIIYRNL